MLKATALVLLLLGVALMGWTCLELLGLIFSPLDGLGLTSYEWGEILGRLAVAVLLLYCGQKLLEYE